MPSSWLRLADWKPRDYLRSRFNFKRPPSWLDKFVQFLDIWMVSGRPEYALKITINGRNLNRVVIDQHYRLKHGDSMNDEIILDLVKTLDGKKFPPEKTQGENEYFAVQPVYRLEKPYRVILVLCLSDDFLGVVNAFRVDE